MSRHDTQRRLLRLAARAPLLGCLDAMVERVAQHVIQRCIEPREDVAIDGNVVACDLKPDVLAKLARKVAHGARERRGRVRKGPHAA